MSKRCSFFIFHNNLQMYHCEAKIKQVKQKKLPYSLTAIH